MQVAVAVILLDALNLLARPEDEADALVQLFGPDVEHPLAPGARAPARLLYNEEIGFAL